MSQSLEEMASLVEKLGSMLRGIMKTKREEVPPGGAVVEAEAPAETKTETEETTTKAESNGEVNKSELVRSYFKRHGIDSRNKDVIEGIKKESGVEVAASMVSFIKSKLPEKERAEKKESTKKSEGSKVWTSKAVSGSALIRDYLDDHGLDASNDEVVNHIKKTKGVDVKPTLVSSVRAMLKRKGRKTSKVAAKVGTIKVAAKKGARKSPTMPSVVVEVLKKAPKEGLELSEVTLKALKSGYKYGGKKDIQGLTQNVYQALHTLSKKIAHPGFKGKTAIVIHEGRRYRLNPKALKNRVA